MYRRSVLRAPCLVPGATPLRASCEVLPRRWCSAGSGGGGAPVPATLSLAQQFDAYKRLIRADKMIGVWLLLLPCWWGQTISHGMLLQAGASTAQIGLAPFDVIGLFSAGAVVMRGAGCIVNDMWDRDFDKQVERTKTRPIASGEVSMVRAFGYLTAHMTIGLGVLLCCHPATILMGIVSVPLLTAYPLFKRFTYLPQLCLGVTFNFGVPMGFAAVSHTAGVVVPVVLPLYCAGISWTMLYDTVYAHQDKADDVKVGVKSSALFFGESKTALHGFGALTTVLICTSGAASGCCFLPAFIPGTVAAGAYLHRALHTTDLNRPADCGKFFVSNKHYGLMICAVFAVSMWLHFVVDSVGEVDARVRESETEREKEKAEREASPYVRNLFFFSNLALIRGLLTGTVPFSVSAVLDAASQ